eukprot:gene11015-biopygen11296
MGVSMVQASFAPPVPAVVAATTANDAPSFSYSAPSDEFAGGIEEVLPPVGPRTIEMGAHSMGTLPGGWKIRDVIAQHRLRPYTDGSKAFASRRVQVTPRTALVDGQREYYVDRILARRVKQVRGKEVIEWKAELRQQRHVRRRNHAQGAALVQQENRGWRELLDPAGQARLMTRRSKLLRYGTGYKKPTCIWTSSPPAQGLRVCTADTPCYAIQRYGQHLWSSQQGTSQSLPGLSNRVAAYPVPRHLLYELFDGLTF